MSMSTRKSGFRRAGDSAKAGPPDLFQDLLLNDFCDG